MPANSGIICRSDCASSFSPRPSRLSLRGAGRRRQLPSTHAGGWLCSQAPTARVHCTGRLPTSAPSAPAPSCSAPAARRAGCPSSSVPAPSRRAARGSRTCSPDAADAWAGRAFLQRGASLDLAVLQDEKDTLEMRCSDARRLSVCAALLAGAKHASAGFPGCSSPPYRRHTPRANHILFITAPGKPALPSESTSPCPACQTPLLVLPLHSRLSSSGAGTLATPRRSSSAEGRAGPCRCWAWAHGCCGATTGRLHGTPWQRKSSPPALSGEKGCSRCGSLHWPCTGPVP